MKPFGVGASLGVCVGMYVGRMYPVLVGFKVGYNEGIDVGFDEVGGYVYPYSVGNFDGEIGNAVGRKVYPSIVGAGVVGFFDG